MGPCNHCGCQGHWKGLCPKHLVDIRKLEVERREKLLSKQKTSSNVVKGESLWTHEKGLLDVVFSKNDNFNENVFEVVIVAFDVKGKDFG